MDAASQDDFEWEREEEAHRQARDEAAVAAARAAADWWDAPAPELAPRKENRSDADAAYDAMEGVAFPWDEITRLAGSGVEGWLKRLQGALQLPMALVFLMVVSLCAFSLHGAQAQCAKMLAVPPLPWLGIVGRAGGGKSLAVWFAKQVMMELQNRLHPPESDDDSDAEAEEAAPVDVVEGAAAETDGAGKRKSTAKDSARKAKRQKRLIADMGTLYGFFAQMAKNGNRAYVALHEGKPFLSKVLAEVPGFDPQALNKAYDRDEVSNTVMSTSSRFTMHYPWMVIFMAVHLEDLKTLFGDAGKDPCVIFARFDFFARDGAVPDIEDFNDYEADDAITFVADVLQLIEAQFVDISKEKDVQARQHPCFSNRSKLWKISQDSQFFKTTYNKHAHAQRGAKESGNDKEASREAKLKTKQCRYATPIDAFLKAFAQKAALDEYRQKQIEQAEGDNVKGVLEGMAIMALRQRVIDKDPALAETLGLPLWPRSVTNEAAEIGYLVNRFLAEENFALVSYLRGGSGPPDLGGKGEKGDDDGDALGGLNDEKLAEALRSLDVDKVKRCMAGLLSLPDKVTLVSAVKKAVRFACDSRIFDCALTLLSHARLASRAAWKQPGKSGAPASYVLLNGEFAEPIRMAQLDTANLLKHFPGASLDGFLKQRECEVSQHVVQLHGAPPVSSACLAAFTSKWFPLLGARASPPDPAASASQAAAPAPEPAPTPPVADAAARLSPEAANAIRAHFRWIICCCTQADIKKTYVQGRIKGFQAESEEWQTLLNTFVAMGLAVNTTKNNSAGCFSLRSPGEENVGVVVEGLKSWFSEVVEKEEKAMTKRFQDIPVSMSFTVAGFQEVIAKLSGVRQ